MNLIKNYGLYIIGLFIATSIFFLPAMSGKKLGSHDSMSNYEIQREITDYRAKGEEVYWTKSAFSGMPGYMIASKSSNNFIGGWVHRFAFGNDNIAMSLFLAMLCSFLALSCFKIDPKIAFFCAVCFGLNTWIIDSLAAGHGTKIVAFSFVALFFAAYINYIRRGGWGFLLTMALSMSISIVVNHIQVTYYGVIMTIFAGVYFLIEAVKNKSLPDFFKKHAFVFLALLLALGSNISNVYNLYDYSKDTMRGGKSELTPLKSENSSTAAEGGLNIKYAFAWSYTVPELLNFVVPDALGGSSNYSVPAKKSELAKMNNIEDKFTFPFYWGEQQFTGAPNFVGVVIIFFFVFFLFYDKTRFRWLLLALFVLSACLGLGKSFMAFNEFLFSNLPMYNKFRTPTMAFAILNFVAILGAGLSIHKLFISENDKNELLKALKNTVIALGVILLVWAYFVSDAGYQAAGDAQIKEQNPNFPFSALYEDRASLFKADLLRAFFILLICAGVIWAYLKNWAKPQLLLIILGLVAVLDLWSVSKRYYDPEIFQEVGNPVDLIPQESYNQMLEADKSHFRVFNTTNNTFNDNYDGYRFSNVGGYSPAKLYRYQDLIDRQLSKGSQPVLDMLNTKYFIMAAEGQKVAQQNPGAMGNAWFVSEVKFASTADEEMDSLTAFNPRKTAFVDKRYAKETKFDGSTDPLSTIALTKYHPDNMEYTSSSASGGYTVFSEVWYRGNTDWKIFIDGKETPMIRTNYALRGCYVPAGNHKIEMKFRPTTLFALMKVSLISTIILLICGLGFGWLWYSKNKEEVSQ